MKYTDMNQGADGGGTTRGYVPKQKETWHELTDAQLEEASGRARVRRAGRYRLKELYCAEWTSIVRPRRFGVLFKRAVREDLVAGVTWVGTASNKSALYEVAAVRGVAA